MSDPQAPVLEVEDLSIAFATRAGPVPAVSGFSCAVRAGEALGLVGESGCGKSTAALGIMRDLGPNGAITGGRIRFRGRDMAALSPAELRRLRGAEIGMVHQEPMTALNPAMRIDRQLMEGAMIHRGASAREARRQALKMIEAVRLPDAERVARAYPHQLSGGQQQRIVIAMALMPRPALLILDEPTTALDVTVEAGIIDLIKGLAAEMGTALLFISHNLGLVLETCDRLCVMYAGRAVETGEVRAVFEEMRHPYTQGLFRSIPLPGADKTARPLQAIPGQLPQPHERPPGCAFGPRCAYFEAGRCDAGEIAMEEVTGRPGHETRCLRWAEIDWDAPAAAPQGGAPPEPGEVVLRAEGLRKYYEVDTHGLLGSGERRVVKANEDLSFELREAETLAIVGESGCGKSTLAKLLLGLETATEGTARLGEDDIAHLPVQRRGRAVLGAIQMVFQNPADTLNPSRAVGAQLVRALEKFGVGRDGRDRRRRMLELLDVVKLPRAFADRLPRQLSGGQKQRIGIARAFAGDARVVVADEPVSALDVSVQAAVTELLTEIQRERRTAMIFISHDLSVVRYLADRVLVMYLGHVVEIGTADQIFAPPYHPYTEALLAAAPIADARVRRRRVVLEGDPPSAIDPPSGCPFQTRCPRKHQVPGDLCERELPPLREIGRGHSFLCHLSEDALQEMDPVIETPRAAE